MSAQVGQKASEPTTPTVNKETRKNSEKVPIKIESSEEGAEHDVYSIVKKDRYKEKEELTFNKYPHVSKFRSWKLEFKENVALGSGRPEEGLV